MKINWQKIRPQILRVIRIACYIITIFSIAFFIYLFVDTARTKKEVMPQTNAKYAPKIEKEVEPYTNIFTDGSNVYYRTLAWSDTKIEGFSPKNARVLGGRVDDAGRRHGPFVLVNDTQVYIVDPEYRYHHSVTVVTNPKKLGYVAGGEFLSDLLSDSIDFYIYTNDNIFKLPIKNGVLVEYSKFIKDKDQVFYGTKKLPGADPKTFEPVVSKMGYKVYGGGWGEPPRYRYGKDAHAAYYENTVIEGADISTFGVYDRTFYQDFAFDKDSIYYEGKKILGADPKSFVILKQQPWEGCVVWAYSKDSNHVYFETNIVQNADANTFKGLINGYGQDAKQMFYKEIPLSIPPNSWEPVCQSV